MDILKSLLLMLPLSCAIWFSIYWSTIDGPCTFALMVIWRVVAVIMTFLFGVAVLLMLFSMFKSGVDLARARAKRKKKEK